MKIVKDKIGHIPHPKMLNRHAYTMVNDKHLSFRAKAGKEVSFYDH